jgi:hypothetical protein
MKKPIEIVREYRKFLEQIEGMIKASGLKDKFIFEKLGMSKTNFYRRLNKPELWTYDELEGLFEILK